MATSGEIDRVNEERRQLRRLLWLNHGHDYMYGDDGQMQCGGLDFKTATAEEIEEHIDPRVAALRGYAITLAPGYERPLIPVGSTLPVKLSTIKSALTRRYGVTFKGDNPDIPVDWVRQLHNLCTTACMIDGMFPYHQ